MTDVETVLKWLREPDFAERFSYADAATWVHRRPLREIMLLCEKVATQERRIAVLETVIDEETAFDDCGDDANQMIVDEIRGRTEVSLASSEEARHG